MTVEAAIEFVDEYLSHVSTYDPAKAHDYYMRTRKLKGRKSGVPDITPAQMKDARDFFSRTERFVNKVWLPLNKKWAALVANDKLSQAEKNAQLKKLKPLLDRADAQADKFHKEYDSKPHIQKYDDVWSFQQKQKETAWERLKPGRVRGAQM